MKNRCGAVAYFRWKENAMILESFVGGKDCSPYM